MSTEQIRENIHCQDMNNKGSSVLKEPQEEKHE